MTEIVNIYDAKTQLSRLVSSAEAGNEIVISRNGKPVVKLVPLDFRPAQRRPGALKGKLHLPDDFDDFTSDDDVDWYGKQ
jgi:prevent-host-death family protein